MDCITLEGMEFFGYHGALPEENVLGQRFIIDVKLGLDLRKAGQEDNLEASVNYAEVYQLVKKLTEGTHCKTIERLGEKIAAAIKEHYKKVQTVTVQVHKPEAPVPGIFRDVSVTLER